MMPVTVSQYDEQTVLLYAHGNEQFSYTSPICFRCIHNDPSWDRDNQRYLWMSKAKWRDGQLLPAGKLVPFFRKYLDDLLCAPVDKDTSYALHPATLMIYPGGYHDFYWGAELPDKKPLMEQEIQLSCNNINEDITWRIGVSVWPIMQQIFLAVKKDTPFPLGTFMTDSEVKRSLVRPADLRELDHQLFNARQTTTSPATA